MQPPTPPTDLRQRANLYRKAVNIVVIGFGLVWLAIIQIRWMVFGIAPVGMDVFIGLAFLIILWALMLERRAQAEVNAENDPNEVFNHQLEDVLASMADLMLVISADGIIQQVNRAALDTLGYSREQMVGQPLGFFLIHNGTNFSVADTLRQQNRVRVTRSFRAQSGHLLPMAVTYTPITGRGTLQGVLCVAQNLSEVESIRAQLHLTNQRYNAAISYSRLGVFEYHPGTNALVVDSNLKLLLAGKSGEIKTLDDALIYIPMEDHHKLFTALNHVLNGKEDHMDVEVRANSVSNGLRWLQVRGALSPGDGRLFGTLMDVTDRKVAEDNLKGSDAVMRAVAHASELFLHSHEWEDHLDDMLSELGRAVGVSRVYVFRNHVDERSSALLTSQFAEWAESPELEQIGNPELQNVDYMATGLDRWVRVLGANEILHGAIESFPPQEQDFFGRQGIQSMLVAPIFVNNQWWGLIGFDDCNLPRVWLQSTLDAVQLAADLLGAAIFRAAADRELEAGREFILSIMNNLGQGVMMVDGTGKLAYVNPAYAQMIGLEPDELVNKRYTTEFTTDEDRAALEYNRGLRARGMVTSYTTHIRHIDGHLTEVLVTGVPRLINGRYDGAYCVVADITERRKLEEQRFELLLERERIRLMSDFVRDISHEFRTPLSIIQTSLYLLKRKPDHPQAHTRLDTIGSQATRLNRLVDDLMLMLELEQAEITPRPLSLNTLAGHVIEHSSKKAEDKQLTLTVAEPTGEVMTHGEEGYLNRALMMLVDNAIEFTPEGGSVTLTVAKDEHHAIITVTDTGVGIPAEELGNIFDHMYKVDKARNTERGGLGLGLSIVRRITALHHGEITVQSEPDKGSTFTIKIPHPSATPPNKPATVATITPEIRALLVRATDEIDRADT